jgi:undecaprenyl-diphosphatase
VPDWIAVIILGIVEGVTEFLPVSSTGHLLIVEHWLPELSPFIRSDLFTVVIQPGAVAAVLALFWRRVLALLWTWRTPASRDYLLKLGVAFGVTGAGGWVFKKLGFALPETLLPVLIATVVGGVLFIVVERRLLGAMPHRDVTWTIALAMAVGQLLAMVFPGASRSGTTILLALMLGLARPQAAEFSFLLGIPTLLAAALKETYDAIQHPPPFPIDWGMVGLGVVVSAVTAFLSVRWLLRFVQTHTFEGFGWYRVALGAALGWFGR